MRQAFSPAFVGIVLGVAATRGGPAQAEAERARIDPKADALLRKMSAALAHTKRFQFDAEHVQEVVTKDGQKLQFVAQSRVSVQRPNMVRSERLGPIANATFYYDGDRITIHGKRTGLYATTAAPATLDAATPTASASRSRVTSRPSSVTVSPLNSALRFNAIFESVDSSSRFAPALSAAIATVR